MILWRRLLWKKCYQERVEFLNVLHACLCTLAYLQIGVRCPLQHPVSVWLTNQARVVFVIKSNFWHLDFGPLVRISKLFWPHNIAKLPPSNLQPINSPRSETYTLWTASFCPGWNGGLETTLWSCCQQFSNFLLISESVTSVRVTKASQSVNFSNDMFL